MKKLAIAFTALAAFSAPALAADMAVKAPLRPAPLAYAPSWTGCYVGGGGGYGLWDQENVGHVGPFTITPLPITPLTAAAEDTIAAAVLPPQTPRAPLTTRTRYTDTVDSGGRGWFGTVQGGCDYQFPLSSYQLVIGACGDYDWSDTLLLVYLSSPTKN